MVAETNRIELDGPAADEAVGIAEGKVVTTLEIALAAGRVLLPRESFDIRFCSTSPGFNEEHLKMDFYQRYNAASIEASGKCTVGLGLFVFLATIVNRNKNDHSHPNTNLKPTN